MRASVPTSDAAAGGVGVPEDHASPRRTCRVGADESAWRRGSEASRSVQASVASSCVGLPQREVAVVFQDGAQCLRTQLAGYSSESSSGMTLSASTAVSDVDVLF